MSMVWAEVIAIPWRLKSLAIAMLPMRPSSSSSNQAKMTLTLRPSSCFKRVAASRTALVPVPLSLAPALRTESR
ncbi:hypothetical protein D3C87_1838000 [compost metagenome]